jgi:hypothetical protein
VHTFRNLEARRKSRSLPSLVLALTLTVGACSTNKQEYLTWVRSDAALVRIGELAKDTFQAKENELVARIVGDGSSRPLAALEHYFRSMTEYEILSTGRESGIAARTFFKVVLKGENVESGEELTSSVRQLWILQLFRTLPLAQRVELCQSEALKGYVDVENDGTLKPFEQSRKPETEKSFFNAVVAAVSPATQVSFKQFVAAFPE